MAGLHRNGNKAEYDVAAEEMKVPSSESLTQDFAIGQSSPSPEGWNSVLRKWIKYLGAEELGVEQIPQSARTNQNPRDLFTVFFSANAGTATMALGLLGPSLFGLGWWDSFLCVLFFNVIGAIPAALIATLGPKMGLRTMIIPRYCFGWWPAKVLVFLNILNQIGWAMVNTIAGATVLYDVGGGKLPLAVAVLLIGLIALIIGLFGYHLVHIYERYSWIAMTLCFCIVAGFGARDFINVPMGSGAVEASSVLSFGTTIVGFELAWVPIAADYGVYMREHTASWKVFAWSFGGLVLSQVLVEALGVAVATLISNPNPAFGAAYDSGGLGGLIGQVFEGHGTGVRNFGKFIEILLSFSTVAVIITNIYSLGLSIQMISTKLLVIPRLIWSLIGGIVFMVAAIAGREHLEVVLENFLNICAYWLTPFCTVLFLDYFCFRRESTYDMNAWNDRRQLPHGVAAFSVFVIGTVLAALCMSQTWWVGPIALAVGNPPFGTDISWEIAIGAVTILYIPLRYLERKYWGL
jgi:NCS1 nucleoside transporter family